MTRASISISPPNDKWIQAQIKSEEFLSRSEVVNDLIRKARNKQGEIDYIRAKLIEAESSGFSSRTPEDVKKTVIKRLQANGQLPLE